MLVLSRKSGQRIQIGDNVVITVLTCRNGHVRLGFDAPHEVFIVREEVQKTVSSSSSARRR